MAGPIRWSVDAQRLRDKLREHYEGRSDPVVISLPKGTYLPDSDLMRLDNFR